MAQKEEEQRQFNRDKREKSMRIKEKLAMQRMTSNRFDRDTIKEAERIGMEQRNIQNREIALKCNDLAQKEKDRNARARQI